MAGNEIPRVIDTVHAAHEARDGDAPDLDLRRRRAIAAAYKDIDAVMAAQRDLVEVVHTLKQVVCAEG